VVEVEDFALTVHLLDRQPGGSVDVTVGSVAEQQGKPFGRVPDHVGCGFGDGLGGAQAIPVVGVAVFDFGDFFPFGAFDGDQVAGLVVAVGGRGARGGGGFDALAEFVVSVFQGIYSGLAGVSVRWPSGGMQR